MDQDSHHSSQSKAHIAHPIDITFNSPLSSLPSTNTNHSIQSQESAEGNGSKETPIVHSEHANTGWRRPTETPTAPLSAIRYPLRDTTARSLANTASSLFNSRFGASRTTTKPVSDPQEVELEPIGEGHSLVAGDTCAYTLVNPVPSRTSPVAPSLVEEMPTHRSSESLRTEPSCSEVTPDLANPDPAPAPSISTGTVVTHISGTTGEDEDLVTAEDVSEVPLGKETQHSTIANSDADNAHSPTSSSTAGVFDPARLFVEMDNLRAEFSELAIKTAGCETHLSRVDDAFRAGLRQLNANLTVIDNSFQQRIETSNRELYSKVVGSVNQRITEALDSRMPKINVSIRRSVDESLETSSRIPQIARQHAEDVLSDHPRFADLA
jgi:hypothetical protein